MGTPDQVETNLQPVSSEKENRPSHSKFEAARTKVQSMARTIKDTFKKQQSQAPEVDLMPEERELAGQSARLENLRRETEEALSINIKDWVNAGSQNEDSNVRN